MKNNINFRADLDTKTENYPLNVKASQDNNSAEKYQKSDQVIDTEKSPTTLKYYI